MTPLPARLHHETPSRACGCSACTKGLACLQAQSSHGNLTWLLLGLASKLLAMAELSLKRIAAYAAVLPCSKVAISTLTLPVFSLKTTVLLKIGLTSAANSKVCCTSSYLCSLLALVLHFSKPLSSLYASHCIVDSRHALFCNIDMLHRPSLHCMPPLHAIVSSAAAAEPF